MTNTRARLEGRLGEWAERLIATSHDLHSHPETSFTEHHAHDRLVALLADAGLQVTPGAYDIPTAFVARAGSGPGPTVAILCEYDALPEIGHACGHNVIATVGAGAGILASRVVDELGGRLVVMGCPAEEAGGGKIDLIEAGAFADLDMALMVHPADVDLTRMDTIAVAQFRVRYRGVASHAAAAPERGRNALDAAVLGYNAVAALRQHIEPSERVHGIFTRAGTAANVVPEETEAIWYVRSSTLVSLAPLVERVHDCLRAGATAAGCTITIEEQNHAYGEMWDNPVLVERYVEIAADLGRRVVEPGPDDRVVGSTDMGNVSQIVPSIHPMIKVAPRGVPIHTEAFARAADSPDADRAVTDGALILARLAAECWSDPQLAAATQRAFGEAIPGRVPGHP